MRLSESLACGSRQSTPGTGGSQCGAGSAFTLIRPRVLAIRDTTPLLRLGLWDAFGAGVACTIAFASLARLLTTFSTLSMGTIQPSGVTFLGLTAGELGALLASFVVALLAGGVITLGVWRGTFAALIRQQTPPSFGRLGIAVGIGSAAGLALGLETALETPVRPALGPLVSAATLGWDLALVIGFVIFAHWVAVGAGVWLRVPTAAAPRLRFAAGLVVAGLVLGAWLGPFFFWRSMLLPPIDTFGSGQTGETPAIVLLGLSLSSVLPMAAYAANASTHRPVPGDHLGVSACRGDRSYYEYRSRHAPSAVGVP